MTEQSRYGSAAIGIVTNTLSRSLAFYADVLGFLPAGHVEIDGVGTMYRMRSQAIEIKIIDSSSPGLGPNVEPASGLTLASGIRFFTLQVDNLDLVVAGCRDFGAEILSEAAVAGPGIRFAMVLDPDRVVIELAERS